MLEQVHWTTFRTVRAPPLTEGFCAGVPMGSPPVRAVLGTDPARQAASEREREQCRVSAGERNVAHRQRGPSSTAVRAEPLRRAIACSCRYPSERTETVDPGPPHRAGRFSACAAKVVSAGFSSRAFSVCRRSDGPHAFRRGRLASPFRSDGALPVSERQHTRRRR